MLDALHNLDPDTDCSIILSSLDWKQKFTVRSTMVESTAESILQLMDEQFFDIIGTTDRETGASSSSIMEPEREIHVDERNGGGWKQGTLNATIKFSEDASISGDGVESLPPRRRKLHYHPPAFDRWTTHPEDTTPQVSVSASVSGGESDDKLSFVSLDSSHSDRTHGTVSMSNRKVNDDSFSAEGSTSSTDVNFRMAMAIDAIREEASKVEAALAIDHLHTLQNELKSTKKLLAAQDDQIKHLKREIKSKNKVLALLELERDLIKADMDDLKQNSRASTASTASVIDTTDEPSSDCYRSQMTVPTPKDTIGKHATKKFRDTNSSTQHTDKFATQQYNCRSHLASKQSFFPCALDVTSRRQSKSHGETSESGSTKLRQEERSQSSSGQCSNGPSGESADMSSRGSSKENRTLADKPSASSYSYPLQLSAPTNRPATAPVTAVHFSVPSTMDMPQNRRALVGSDITYFSINPNSILATSSKEIVGDSPSRQFRESNMGPQLAAGKIPRSLTTAASQGDDIPNLRRLCGASLFRRRQKRQGKETIPINRQCHHIASTNPSGRRSRNDTSSQSLQEQVEELAQRLQSSIEGSGDLRKRLAMISRYYETTVHRLHENIVALKREQTAMKKDLIKQIKSIDHERLISIKQNRALLKELELLRCERN